MNNRKQHYVPQFYLKRFSKPHKNSFRISVYDKSRNRFFSSNVKDIASSNYFYDFPSLKEYRDLYKEIDFSFLNFIEKNPHKEQLIEKLFSDSIESQFATTLNNIVSKFTLNPNPFSAKEILTINEKELLSFHLSLQITRTPKFRTTQINLIEQMNQAIPFMLAKQNGIDVDKKDFNFSINDEVHSLMHAASMFDLGEEISLKLTDHVWNIGVNNTKTPLYTSDNPVVQFSHVKDELKGTGGFASYGVEIAFPINEKLILILLERSYYTDQNMSIENQFIKLSEENVTYYNYLQVIRSSQQIFSSTPDFKTVHEIIEKDPTLLENKEELEIFIGGRKF